MRLSTGADCALKPEASPRRKNSAGIIRSRHGTVSAFGMAIALETEACRLENQCLRLHDNHRRFLENHGPPHLEDFGAGRPGRLRSNRPFTGWRIAPSSHQFAASRYQTTTPPLPPRFANSTGAPRNTTQGQPCLSRANEGLRSTAGFRGANEPNRSRFGTCDRNYRRSWRSISPRSVRT